MTEVKGKVVLITGAAGGIGFCTAEEFSKAGSRVVMTDINADRLAESADELRKRGGEIYHYHVDISDQDQVYSLIETIKRDVGKIDVLINNAGIGHNAEIVETDLRTWKRLMDVNFWGSLYHIYAVLPDMIEQQGGHILNVSSGQAFFRLPTWGVYATIKLALGAFSEMLHYEISKFGVKVTTVYPFMVNTPFYQDIQGDTYLARLSMKLIPYYSNTPQTVGRKIFKAIRHDERVEMVNIINYAGFFTHAIPPLSTVVSTLSAYFLGKKKEEVTVVKSMKQSTAA